MNSIILATSVDSPPQSRLLITDTVEWRGLSDRPRASSGCGFLRPLGISVVMALSPLTALADPWMIEPRRQTQPTAIVVVHTSKRRISRAEALRIARDILRRAELERAALAEEEASRGVRWGETHDLHVS